MAYKKNFKKKRPKKELQGLMVEVYNGDVEKAMKIFKRKVKESNIILDLRKKAYYEKPSKLRREKRNLAKLRNKYNLQKEEKDY